MQITVSQEQGRVPVTVLELDGLLNIGTAELLENHGRAAYEAGSRCLLLDMGKLASLTSAGLRSILRLSQLYASGKPGLSAEGKASPASKHSGMKLLNPNQQIENVLTIAGFTGFLDIYKDRQEAIDSFG